LPVASRRVEPTGHVHRDPHTDRHVTPLQRPRFPEWFRRIDVRVQLCPHPSVSSEPIVTNKLARDDAVLVCELHSTTMTTLPEDPAAGKSNSVKVS
jgi:hypothetical protein